ncbi:MAG: hypothetical protein R3Y16_06855 [Rikenellaceae bacterium]
MKKILLMAAATAVALSSCSKNEVTVTSSDNQAIGFGVYTGVATKGTETSSTSIQAEGATGFGVYAYYHAAAASEATTPASFSTTSTPDFMYNEQVTYYTNSQWEYSPVKYWPNNELDRISFFAYAPYASTGFTVGANSTSAAPEFEFTIADDPKNMIDLTADMQYNLAKTSDYTTSTDSEVKFVLEHILTRAAFNVVLGDDIINTTDAQAYSTGTTVYVTDLQLVGSANSTGGSATTDTKLYDKGGSPRDSKNFYSKGTYTVSSSTDIATNLGSWDLSTTDAYALQTDNYSLVTSGFFAGTLSNTTSLQDGSDGGATTDDYIPANYLKVESSSKSMFATNQYLFLIPPATTSVTAGDESVLVYIEYDVVTADDNLTNKYSKVTNRAIVALSGLAEATAYSYTFTLGLSSVKVSAEVTEWKTDIADADVETDESTTQTVISTTVVYDTNNATSLTNALTTLNTLAGTSSVQTKFAVDAKVIKVESTTGTITISGVDLSNFKVGDEIAFTFADDSDTTYVTTTLLSITDSSSKYEFEYTSDDSNFTVTATIKAAAAE